MRPELRNLTFSFLFLATFTLGSTGCRVTENDVETWKGTVKGPSKMVAVLLADKYDLQLRTHAALALVEMQRSDIDGTGELLAALQKLDPPTREKVLAGIVPGLTKAMSEGKVEPGAEPPPGQIRAKDAAFALISQAGPSAETRKGLTAAVMSWYVTDFDGRSLAGAYSAEQVVRALGASAAGGLVDALNARSPQQALIKLAELIAQVGDVDTKKRAAHKLVEIEVEMNGAPFLDWLKQQINTQLAATPGAKVDAARVDKTALLNRDKFIDEGVIPAMRHLADQPQIALDPKAPSSVRDYAFDRVGDTQSARAIPALWPLVQDPKDQRLRWRAGELVLALGGTTVLAEFISKLPVGPDVKYEPEELEGYATRLGQMSPLPRQVAQAQLSSPEWHARVLALQFFARKGTQADIRLLEPLVGDSAATKGAHWPKDSTVGKVASQAIAGLRERLTQGQSG